MATSGLGSSFSLGVESTYGTSVSTTRMLPFISESIQTVPDRIEPTIIWPGHAIPPAAGWREGATTHAGSIDFVASSWGQEELWRIMCGGYSFATATHTFTLDVADESHTHAFGYGGTTSVPSKTYDGGVCTGWTFGANAGEEAVINTDWVYQGLTTSDSDTIAGTVPSLLNVMSWADFTTVTVGGASFDCVRGFSLTVDSGYDVEQLCLGSLEISDPRVRSSAPSATGVLTVDFEDFATATPTVIDDFLTSAAAQAIVITSVNGTATFTFTLQARIDGNMPNLSGLDIVTFDVPFTCVSDAGDDTAAFTLTVANGTTTL